MTLVKEISRSRLQKVWRTAVSVVQERGFSDPHRAMGDCGVATRVLQSRLEPLPSYRFETRVECLPDGCPWREESDGPAVTFAWHMMLAVPMVGIVDASGAQFLRSTPRVLREVPVWWDGLVGIEPSDQAPCPSTLDSSFVTEAPVEVSRGLALLLHRAARG
jgi:hypothetical protein